MGFREHLDSLVRGVDGAVAASVMGFDGIAIDTVEPMSPEEAPDVDVQTLLVEYSNILNQLCNVAEVLQSGSVTELSVNTEKLLTIARLISEEYFVIIAIVPRANYGKARYLLRMSAPRIATEL